MIKHCFINEFQGHRWCFKKSPYTNTVQMIDTLGKFPTIEITDEMAEILSKQLNYLQQYQNEDKQDLLLPNLLLNFIKENKDIDKDIIITLIDNLEKWVKRT